MRQSLNPRKRAAGSMSQAVGPILESLENRQLLTATLHDGLLDVIGTQRPDHIKVVLADLEGYQGQPLLGRFFVDPVTAADHAALDGHAGSAPISHASVTRAARVMDRARSERLSTRPPSLLRQSEIEHHAGHAARQVGARGDQRQVRDNAAPLLPRERIGVTARTVVRAPT